MAQRGRPPLDPADRSVSVCVKLPSRHYDNLYRRARKARVSVPEVVRRVLEQRDKRNPK